MEWYLRDNSVYLKTGRRAGNHIAAFDFDNTLAWSDSGLIFMRTADDWVITTDPERIISLFRDFDENNWTIVIFVNLLQNDPAYTTISLRRIDNFIRDLQLTARLHIR